MRVDCGGILAGWRKLSVEIKAACDWMQRQGIEIGVRCLKEFVRAIHDSGCTLGRAKSMCSTKSRVQ